MYLRDGFITGFSRVWSIIYTVVYYRTQNLMLYSQRKASDLTAERTNRKPVPHQLKNRMPKSVPSFEHA
jgi:hypothetical protein